MRLPPARRRSRSFRCRSGVAVHHALGASVTIELPTSDYHGTYIAAAEVTLGTLGPVACVSAHASPEKHLRPEDLERWIWTKPSRRRLDSRDTQPLWDADYVLQTLGDLAAAGPVLAGGDFSEARAWDDQPDNDGHAGEDFFAFAEGRGLCDLTYSLWGNAERVTNAREKVESSIRWTTSSGPRVFWPPGSPPTSGQTLVPTTRASC